MSTGKFTVLKITKFSDITETTELPKSDLAMQDDKAIYQFKYKRREEEDDNWSWNLDICQWNVWP